MSEPIAVVVPKELYYHEVDYVRGLEARVAELEAALTEKTGEAERQYDYNVSQIARVTKLEGAGENVIIAFGMGWDMDGVIEVLRAALKDASKSGSE